MWYALLPLSKISVLSLFAISTCVIFLVLVRGFLVSSLIKHIFFLVSWFYLVLSLSCLGQLEWKGCGLVDPCPGFASKRWRCVCGLYQLVWFCALYISGLSGLKSITPVFPVRRYCDRAFVTSRHIWVGLLRYPYQVGWRSFGFPKIPRIWSQGAESRQFLGTNKQVTSLFRISSEVCKLEGKPDCIIGSTSLLYGSGCSSHSSRSAALVIGGLNNQGTLDHNWAISYIPVRCICSLHCSGFRIVGWRLGTRNGLYKKVRYGTIPQPGSFNNTPIDYILVITKNYW